MKSILKYAVVVGVLAFWVAYVYANWQSFASLSWRLDPVLLAGGFLAYCAFYLSVAIGWYLTLRALGCKADFVQVIHIWISVLPARYLPGKFWHIAGRTYLAEQAGISKQDLFVSSYLEHVLLVVGGLMVFILSLPIGGAVLDQANLYYLILIPLGLSATHPRLLRALFGLAARLLRKGQVRIDLAFPRVLALLAWFACCQVLSGISLFLVVQAISPAPLHVLPVLVGASAFAWVLGLITLIAPGGLGVRETTIVVIASPFLPVPLVSSAAFVTRFLAVSNEAVLFVASHALVRLLRKRVKNELPVSSP